MTSASRWMPGASCSPSSGSRPFRSSAFPTAPASAWPPATWAIPSRGRAACATTCSLPSTCTSRMPRRRGSSSAPAPSGRPTRSPATSRITCRASRSTSATSTRCSRASITATARCRRTSASYCSPPPPRPPPPPRTCAPIGASWAFRSCPTASSSCRCFSTACRSAPIAGSCAPACATAPSPPPMRCRCSRSSATGRAPAPRCSISSGAPAS